MSPKEFEEWLAVVTAEIFNPAYLAERKSIAQSQYVKRMIAQRQDRISPDPNPTDHSACGNGKRVSNYEMIKLRGD